MTDYNPRIDSLKGTCILFVIISNIGKTPFYEYTTKQAIPIFIILMGYNYYRRLDTKPFYIDEYYKKKIPRFVKPFILVWIMSATILFMGLALDKIPRSLYLDHYLLIGVLPTPGPGNWFIPFLVYFVILYPLIFAALKRNFLITSIFMILTSFALNNIPFTFEVQINIFTYGNYIIAGAILNKNTRARNKALILLMPLDTLYPIIITWLWINGAPRVPPLEEIGKLSYHIFLMQILFFANIPITELNIHPAITTLAAIPLCIIGGRALKIRADIFRLPFMEGNK